MGHATAVVRRRVRHVTGRLVPPSYINPRGGARWLAARTGAKTVRIGWGSVRPIRASAREANAVSDRAVHRARPEGANKPDEQNGASEGDVRLHPLGGVLETVLGRLVGEPLRDDAERVLELGAEPLGDLPRSGLRLDDPAIPPDRRR